MATTDLRATGLNHVVLHVRDIERSTRFYVDILGFESRNTDQYRERGMSFLLCGMQGLDLFERTHDVHGGEEMNHMALNVDADDLPELKQQIAEAGITEFIDTGRGTVFVHDPDRHQIEMLPRNSREREREAAQASR